MGKGSDRVVFSNLLIVPTRSVMVCFGSVCVHVLAVFLVEERVLRILWYCSVLKGSWV